MVAGGIIMDDYLCFDVILILDVEDDVYFEMEIFRMEFYRYIFYFLNNLWFRYGIFFFLNCWGNVFEYYYYYWNLRNVIFLFIESKIIIQRYKWIEKMCIQGLFKFYLCFKLKNRVDIFILIWHVNKEIGWMFSHNIILCRI